MREEIPWVPDEDLSRLEAREEMAAASLSFFTGGGGQLYVSDYRRGFVWMAAQLGAAALGLAVGAPAAWLPFVGIGAVSAVNAWRKARGINRFLSARGEAHERQGPHPAAYRLLAAMSAVDPTAIREAAAFHGAARSNATEFPSVRGPDAAPEMSAAPRQPAAPPNPLLERLRKLAAVREAGAMTDGEFRARKVDLLEASVSGIDRDALDELLYELLPLIEERILDSEDIAFVKELVGA